MGHFRPIRWVDVPFEAVTIPSSEAQLEATGARITSFTVVSIPDGAGCQARLRSTQEAAATDT